MRRCRRTSGSTNPNLVIKRNRTMTFYFLGRTMRPLYPPDVYVAILDLRLVVLQGRLRVPAAADVADEEDDQHHDREPEAGEDGCRYERRRPFGVVAERHRQR